MRVGTGRYTTPEKAEQVRAWESTGEAAQKVLVMLAAQKRTRTECYDAAAEVVGEADARIVMQRLARDSLIVATNQCYSITPRGLKRVPRAAVVIQPMRPYVPPASPPAQGGQHVASGAAVGVLGGSGMSAALACMAAKLPAHPVADIFPRMSERVQRPA